jgi:DNA-binding SARP family transcriptional activator/TolB-like protein
MELNVRLFGGFEVRRSTGPLVTIGTRKAKALFALIARRSGQLQARETLSAMFWPDHAESDARRNLRQALKLVRRAVVECGTEIIVSEGDAVMLEPGAAEVDADLFERLHEAGTSESLERAAGLYRGDFLEGTTLADGPFQDWSTIERMQLHERAADVFSRLLSFRIEAGRTEAAIDIALRLLALDPLQEDVHRCLMQLYLRQGRRGSALEQYRICCRVLERELGIGPSPETDDLYREVHRSAAAAKPRLPDLPSSESVGTPGEDQRVDALLALPALAVIPFENLSGDAEKQYFSDGLSADLITALAGWRSFPLIAFSSTHACRDAPFDCAAVAQSLNARYLVNGSVRTFGDRLRISANLIEGETSRYLWAESFDFQISDILEIQEEAARQIASIIEPELERAELRRILGKRPQDLTAWDHCLQGRAGLHRTTIEGNAPARKAFETAIELDPEYSDAFAGLATSYNCDLILGTGTDRATLIRRAHDAARRAVELDGRSSAAHRALAAAHVWLEDFEVAIPETRLAVDLNPSDAHARMALGNRLDLVDRAAEGVAQMERGLRLNPRDPLRAIYMGYLARANIILGDYETAVHWARSAVMVQPDNPDVQFRLAAALAHLGEKADALNALERAESARPGFLESRRNWRPYGDDDRNDQYFAGLRRLDLFG